MKNLLWGFLLVVIVFPAFAADRESVYDRVMRTQTIRCGYAVWAPDLMRDPNTGKFSGVIYDLMEEVGKATGFKIEWTEEVGFGAHVEALRDSRFDVFCTGFWPSAKRAPYNDHTRPVYFVSVDAYVRNDDRRFDGDLQKVKTEGASVSVIDGEMSSIIADALFPDAKRVALPQMTDPVQMLMNVATGKADITFTDMHTAQSFMEANPGTLRQVPLERPVRIVPVTLAIAVGEERLKSMLNTAIDQMQYDGVIEMILKKYETQSRFLRVAEPYEASK